MRYGRKLHIIQSIRGEIFQTLICLGGSLSATSAERGIHKRLANIYSFSSVVFSDAWLRRMLESTVTLYCLKVDGVAGESPSVCLTDVSASLTLVSLHLL